MFKMGCQFILKRSPATVTWAYLLKWGKSAASSRGAEWVLGCGQKVLFEFYALVEYYINMFIVYHCYII